MINPNELRLGNYIISAKATSTVPWQINIEDFSYILEHPENYMPFRLDEQWLEKFGFQMITEKNKLGLPSDFFKYDFVLHAGHHEWWYGWMKNLNVRIDYIHELQNLYFAIIKKELTIYNQ